MFRILSYGILGVALLSSLSCSSIRVYSDIDETEDFTQLKTYQFTGWNGVPESGLSDLEIRRMGAVFKNEAEKRGLTSTDSNGDMLVALAVYRDIRTEKVANTTQVGGGMMMGGPGMMMGAPGMRVGMMGPGWGWGVGHSTTVIQENQFLDKSILVEVFDPEGKKLIWQALGTRSDVSNDPKRRSKEIEETVKAIMKRYPVKPKK